MVVDVREQFPLLPLDATLSAARRLGLPHPCEPRTRQPLVMTTDFLVTHVSGNDLARTFKPIDNLSKRAIEKFAIEHLYWYERNIDWKLVTDREIPATVAWNVDWLCDAGDEYIQDRPGLSPERIVRIERNLRPKVLSRNIPLTRLTNSFDMDSNYEPGTSLAAVKYILATRQWRLDMTQRIDPSGPLQLIGAEEICL
jgi:hypothetical protein